MEIYRPLLNILKTLVYENNLHHLTGVGRHSIYDIENILNGIYFVLRTGCQWYALDKTIYGKHKTIHKYFVKFTNFGLFEMAWKHVLKIGLKLNKLDFLKLSIDASFIKNRRGIDCIGRCSCDRGRNATKHSMITTKQGIPIASLLAPGNRSDIKLLEETFNKIICERPKPSRKNPQYVLADRGYDSEKHRILLRNQGYIPKIPLRRNSKRILTPYQKKLYREDSNRCNIEITFGRLDSYQRIIQRKERYIKYYESFLNFALTLVSYSKIFD